MFAINPGNSSSRLYVPGSPNTDGFSNPLTKGCLIVFGEDIGGKPKLG